MLYCYALHSNVFSCLKLQEDIVLNIRSCYEELSAVDVLNADSLFKILPELNRKENVSEIIALTQGILPSLAAVESFSQLEALCALRDLGMFSSSIKRWKLEPREYVP